MRVQVAGANRVLAGAVETELRRRGVEPVGSRPEVVVAVPAGRRAEAGALATVLEGAGRVVVASRVGVEVVPLPAYRRRLAVEEAAQASGSEVTVLRFTHLHPEVWQLLGRLSRLPVMVVAHDTRLQPLDPAAAAVRLVDAVENRPEGRREDLGGPTAYDLADLARSHLAATGRRRPVLRLNAPGIAGAALRAGAALTPNRDHDGRTWNEFVADQLGEEPPG